MGMVYLIYAACAVELDPANLVSLAAPLAVIVVVLDVIDDFIGHGSHQVTQEPTPAATAAVISVENRSDHHWAELS